MQRSERPNTSTKPNHETVERCKILAKKGYLSARNITSGIAVLLYSREFQLGVLLNMPVGDDSALPDSDEHIFAQSAMAMILTEFQTLGVRKQDLVTYAIGGSCVAGDTGGAQSLVKRTLWSHGLKLSASDLGGEQIRSIWMDVETGRTIIRSERMQSHVAQDGSHLCAAS